MTFPLCFAPLCMEQYRLVASMTQSMAASSRIMENKGFVQHGTTSLFTHCRNVALVSLKLCGMLRLSVDTQSLVRGALLHDYFLYDWHGKDHPGWHGFRHPYIALRNASRIYTLTPVEKDIIVRHMFPLTVLPPKTKEGWIVSLSDKLCSLYETFKLNEKHKSRRCHYLAKQPVL